MDGQLTPLFIAPECMQLGSRGDRGGRRAAGRSRKGRRRLLSMLLLPTGGRPCGGRSMARRRRWEAEGVVRRWRLDEIRTRLDEILHRQNAWWELD